MVNPCTGRSDGFSNLFTETTVKQFFKNRPSHKPQYVLALRDINESNYKKFAINMSFAEKNQDHFNMAINNYFKQIIFIDELNIQPIRINEVENESYFWFICLTDLNLSSCDILKDPKYKILEEKNYNSTNLKLIKLSN